MEPILFVTSDGLRRHDPGDDVMLGNGSEPASQADAEAVIRDAAALQDARAFAELVPDPQPEA